MQKRVEKSDWYEINTLISGQIENINCFQHRVDRITKLIVRDVVRYQAIKDNNSFVKTS